VRGPVRGPVLGLVLLAILAALAAWAIAARLSGSHGSALRPVRPAFTSGRTAAPASTGASPDRLLGC
jgi:hypothetical protein